MNSPKQTAVLKHLAENATMTLDTAVELIGQNLYANAKFHVGTVLSNMVKRKMIERVKPGVFKLPTKHEAKDLTLK